MPWSLSPESPQAGLHQYWADTAIQWTPNLRSDFCCDLIQLGEQERLGHIRSCRDGVRRAPKIMGAVPTLQGGLLRAEEKTARPEQAIGWDIKTQENAGKR